MYDETLATTAGPVYLHDVVSKSDRVEVRVRVRVTSKLYQVEVHWSIKVP